MKCAEVVTQTKTRKWDQVQSGRAHGPAHSSQAVQVVSGAYLSSERRRKKICDNIANPLYCLVESENKTDLMLYSTFG